jgi:hypothetical protein
VITHVLRLALAASFIAIPARAVRAQAPSPVPPNLPPALRDAQAPASPVKEGALLKVQVVISRYQGEKKISSQPYTVSVREGIPASLRMGMQVAIPASAPSTDAKATVMSAVMYKDVGTSIDCNARSLDGGRYQLELSIDDSSLAASDQTPTPFASGVPQFRSFRIQRATAILRDGQTMQLTTATEKVTGEVAKVDVTLNVVK